jgi:hypothetical protein
MKWLTLTKLRSGSHFLLGFTYIHCIVVLTDRNVSFIFPRLPMELVVLQEAPSIGFSNGSLSNVTKL